ncbi:hypothetical protein [Streptomyces sp. NPDC090036]|uniref:hypothetical protein n=1 Tax=Streptomyces sp. NPDC090036 TaxID=3365926 RepID=UPI00381F1EAE
MNAHRSSSPSPSSAPPRTQRLLAIYLNDHLAGASSGVALIRRMARTHRGTPAGPPLAELAEDVSADRETLREVMTALDIPAQWSRVVVGRLAEKVGRVKLNGRLVSRSPLSDVLELEAMRIGVEGKEALWKSLAVLAGTHSHLERAAVDRLLSRARDQAAVLEGLREEAARRTFTPTPMAADEPAHSGRGRLGRASRPGRSHRARWA